MRPNQDAPSDEPEDRTRNRRALTHVGGAVDVEGPTADTRPLAHALDVAPATDADDEPARGHVHGFHTYPARLHPETAARLVRAFVPPGADVLDPFCGSGTVLVEAMIAGRRPLGTDLNPLAVRPARCKTRPRTPAELDDFVAKANECAAHAEKRRTGRAGATRRYPTEDVTLFEPHVLLELDSLRDKVDSYRGEAVRLDLSLILSSVLVKLSKKRADTSAGAKERRTAAGFASKLFVQRAEEWARRLAELAERLPKPFPPAAFVTQDDACVLKTLPPGGVGAIVTSPPYAATYDYLAHHEMRLRWLDLDPRPLVRGEIGARSAYHRIDPRDAHARWANELSRFLRAAAGVLPPNGPLVMIVADSAVGGLPLRADAIVAEVARGCGFDPAARASQPRPHFHGPTMKAFRDRPRFEHALLLRRMPGGERPV